MLDKLDHPARITGHVSGNPVINPAVIRQQMGRVRSDDRLDAGEMQLEHVQAEFSAKNGNGIVVL